MPSKGAKRALSAEAGLESKRLKETLKGYGVSKACYDAVAEAVELSELPESVRRMLVTTIPESLCVPKSQRHAFQDQHVNMLENALEQLKLQRQGALETKRLALVEAEALVEDKRLGATRAGEAVETQREALLEAKLRLAEVTKEVIRSKADVALKHTALMDFEKEISRSQEEKQLVSEAMHNEFRALRDGSVEGSEAQALYAKLEAIAERIGIETSLMKAVSSSILKLPNLRGSFDAMVVAQLQEGLKKRLNDLDQQLKATEKQQELCDAKALATKSLEEALGQQELKAEVFTEAQKLLESRETELIEAKKQADLAEPGRVKAVDGLEGAKMDMQNFDEYHWACFEKLRDHEIKVEAVEVAPTAEAGA